MKKIVLGKWSPIVNADDLVTGWKVVKDWPSWVLDVDAREQFVVDIEDHAAG